MRIEVGGNDAVALARPQIVGAAGELAPADAKLYALRDATATVESLPLVASSVMSKKLAEGTGALVLDVKVGSGALMTSEAQSRELARSKVVKGKDIWAHPALAHGKVYFRDEKELICLQMPE